MKTIDIKGKAYVTVNERILEFHRKYPNGSISTKMFPQVNGVVVFQAIATPDIEHEDRAFTGHAYEKEGSTFINKTSYIENCETSAVGRALGMLGIGIDTSIASADEMQNAMANQNTDKPLTEKQMSTIVDYVNELKVDIPKFCAFMKVTELDEITQSQYQKAIAAFQAKEKNQ